MKLPEELKPVSLLRKKWRAAKKDAKSQINDGIKVLKKEGRKDDAKTVASDYKAYEKRTSNKDLGPNLDNWGKAWPNVEKMDEYAEKIEDAISYYEDEIDKEDKLEEISWGNASMGGILGLVLSNELSDISDVFRDTHGKIRLFNAYNEATKRTQVILDFCKVKVISKNGLEAFDARIDELLEKHGKLDAVAHVLSAEIMDGTIDGIFTK